MKIFPREPVVFAEYFQALVDWYKDVLSFKVTHIVNEEYHYCNLENENGIRLGIADAREMGVNPSDRKNNTVVLQLQVTDVPSFLKYIRKKAGTITFGPSLDKKGDFWYGGFSDLEGNPYWVVDENCR
ncbi:MAG: hypothetical protein HQ534_08320 [Armatimonadetes bacterium]|nr:hypothetical protein [Armatimonadota bacterium]